MKDAGGFLRTLPSFTHDPHLVKKLLYLLLALIALLAAVGWWLHEPRPEGQSGAAADALARDMMAAVNAQAWDSTGAVRWTFPGGHQHLWDRQRHLAQVRWDDYEVLVNLNTRRGVAFENGTKLSAGETEDLVEQAWAFWVNDAFWLNPVVKAFDQGTERLLVDTEGDPKALLVRYRSGGATPGDAYLWHLDPETKRPQRWKMWVSVIPVGGLSATWSGWQQLATGAWVATHHEMGPVPLEITDLTGASTLTELAGGEDPFAPLAR